MPNCVVDTKCHVRQEWGLGTSQIVGSISIENFAVVFDAETEVLDHRFGQITSFVDNLNISKLVLALPGEAKGQSRSGVVDS